MGRQSRKLQIVTVLGQCKSTAKVGYLEREGSEI